MDIGDCNANGQYPALWSDAFPRKRRTPDQHDANSVARWLREADREGRLGRYFDPPLSKAEREVAAIEGWIFGVLEERQKPAGSAGRHSR